MFMMRFDMRAPGEGAAARDLYGAALEMAAWGETQGCAAIQVSEHHASPDGYLPAPLVLAAAIAARTERVPIQVAALLVPLHDPVDLAEQMIVLDLLSGGRVSYVTAIGYREEEYAMFGHAMRGRGRRMEACLEVLQRAFAGERFEYEGRPVNVTPAPHTAGGPLLLMGGNSPVAARRAARFGMGLLTQGGDPKIAEIYAEECERLGREPGICINPPSGTVTSAFVARDPDAAWAKWGPHLLHDARMYAAWMTGAKSVTRSAAADVASLRAEQGPYRIFTPEQAVAHIAESGVLMTQPLCGGLPPDEAWQSLRLIADEVLPKL